MQTSIRKYMETRSVTLVPWGIDSRCSLPFSVVGVTNSWQTAALDATFASATGTLQATVGIDIFVPYV